MLLSFAPFAFSKSLTFNFQVWSSGPDIFACNAGLKHPATNQVFCYDVITNAACTAGTHNCECSGANGGAYLMDFFNASYANYDVAAPISTISKQAGQSSYATLFTDSAAWQKKLSTLSFNFGSELYGTEYFLDICFLGPQIEYYHNNVTSNWSHDAKVTVTDLLVANGLSYADLADLEVKAETVCDLQADGDYVYAASDVPYGSYNNFVNEVVMGSTDNDYVKTTSYTPVTGNTQHLIATWIIQNSTKSPRYCKTRYSFKETAVQNFRKWQIHGAQVSTWTKYEEDAE
jgi:hypothetical protein